MFTADERSVILQGLWLLKRATGQVNAGEEVPPEGQLAIMGVFDVIHSAVEKLGGDPEAVGFGF